VFELKPGSNGKWKETILHRFTNDSGNGDGGEPWPDQLFVDSTGNIYGTTLFGVIQTAGLYLRSSGKLEIHDTDHN
jgi:hypothetical protein